MALEDKPHVMGSLSSKDLYTFAMPLRCRDGLGILFSCDYMIALRVAEVEIRKDLPELAGLCRD
jgi:hypothetical protein